MSNERYYSSTLQLQQPMDQDPIVDFQSILKEVSDVISPVWPLKDYVAVNPYFGLAGKRFLAARAFLRVFSDCDALMPLSYYARQVANGRLEISSIAAALEEVVWPNSVERPTVEQIESLVPTWLNASPDEEFAIGREERQIRTVAECAESISKVRWSSLIRDEITKVCSAQYDDGQASWASPWKHLPLYASWKSAARYDLNPEIAGLKGMRALVDELPHSSEAAIAYLLNRLRVPQALWATVLLCEAFSIPGWCAWAKYQNGNEDAGYDALTDLLAIRLAYDVAVGQALELEVDWGSYIEGDVASFSTSKPNVTRNVWLRYTLLRATEIQYRKQLLASLRPGAKQERSTTQKLAQWVFCIDVRSERMRRCLESVSEKMDTFGFAGFFGVPMQYTPLGEKQSTSQLPVLLKPQFSVLEEVTGSQSPSQVIERRQDKRTWRKLWREFQTSAVGCFGFVESTGMWAGIKLFSRTLRMAYTSPSYANDGLAAHTISRPTLPAEATSTGVNRQVDLVTGILRNLGLTRDFARLVVLCGHHTQTCNNPLNAGLDCGACGGHSGEPNARLVASLLNRPDIRLGLSERGIIIPPGTHFIAATHNTCIDQIDFYDADAVPTSHHEDFEELRLLTEVASHRAANERMPTVGAKDEVELLRRAKDWSETRPEWGLAGNAAMIIGPRRLTRNATLDARTFLVSYEAAQDTDGAVLETIMTAPMIVANWINMQYYASSVDNRHFGSGDKTIHNVVGRFGILAGGGGDLQTGLPMQSVHNGCDYQHAPLRLLVVIAADRSAIKRIIDKHELVANLATNGWLELVAVEGTEQYRYASDGEWTQLDGQTTLQ